jgi:excisionase family DNA binding protein
MVNVLTIGEVAQLLRVHPATIYRLLKKKGIPAFRVGFDWRFSREAVEAWMKESSAEIDK